MPTRADGLIGKRRTRWPGVLAIVILGFLLVPVIFADWLAPYPPARIAIRERLQPPSRVHPFGTDDFGRDLLSRVLHGARISLGTSGAIICMAGTVGIVLGLAAGYFGGRTDFVIMRVTDLFFTFPSFILAMAIAAVLGPSIGNLVIAVTVVWWPSYCRLVRSEAIRVRTQPYVEAALALGATPIRIIVRHVLPNCMRTILVKATTDVAYTLLTVSGLNFVGLGAQPPTPELGSMVAAARPYIMEYPWWATFPGLAILLSATGFAFLGDFLEDKVKA